ncbi:MAG: hypothetical protein AAFY29_11820 [Pseudomonadota bacterium]
MNVDAISTFLMAYAVPGSFAVLAMTALWLFVRTGLKGGALLFIGALLVFLNQISQYFFPPLKVVMDGSGNVLNTEGPSLVTYVFSILSSVGLVLIAVAFVVLASRLVVANDT